MGNKNKILVILSSVLIVFLIVLTVYVVVDIQNSIKEGRYIGKEIESKNTIKITETGEIYTKPDIAMVNFSVVTERKKPSEALLANAEKMNEVINFIKSKGIEEKDLKTTTFSVYPRYEYRQTGERILTGYEARQNLQVKIRDLDKISSIIDGAVSAGANQVGNLQFIVDNEEEIKKQARELAIKKAKNKAKELASQLGVKLGDVVDFSESGTVPEEPVLYRFESMPPAVSSASPQIETGENKISVTVTITYEIY